MPAFHHGITAQELTQGILPMRNAQISVLGLVVISDDADDDMYPLDTPVLLTGITQDNIDKAGETGTLKNCLQTIRDIHNPTLVVLRLSDPTDADSLDVLLECQSRLGVTPKRLGAPEIDTPAIARKLVSIAKRRRAMVYASPRNDDSSLVTDKTEIVAYRDTFGDREICIIENDWGSKHVISNLCQPAPSAWSKPITFDMVNHPNQEGFISVSFDRQESPNYGIDLNSVSTIEQFFDALNERAFFGPRVEYRAVEGDAVEIRFKDQMLEQEVITPQHVPVIREYQKRGSFYEYDESNIGNMGETSIVLADAFAEDVVTTVSCQIPYTGPVPR